MSISRYPAEQVTQFGDVVVGFHYAENNNLTMAYYDCVGASIKAAESKDMMFNFQLSAFEDRDAQIVVAIDKLGQVVGGLHWQIDAAKGMMIRAVVVTPRARGRKIGQALAAYSIIQAEELHGDHINPFCAIRVLADGTENIRSAKTFMHLGFRCEATSHQKFLSGDFTDKHLFENAETDVFGRKFIRYKKMFATAATSKFSHEFFSVR